MFAAALALVVTAPLLGPGFVLAYDMVFVPSPHLGLASVGIARSLPRAGVSELAVALLARVLTGKGVQDLALVGVFALAAWGAARLVPVRRTAARLAGGALYAWNPMTYERLLLGQWVLLLGYALLPWVAAAAVDLRRGRSGSGRRLVMWLAGAGALGPYAGVFAFAVAAAVALWPPRVRLARLRPQASPTWRNAALLVGAAAVTSLPWLLPSALGSKPPSAAALGVRLFRARADGPLGTVGSLVSLGGVWRTDLAPPGRSGAAWIPAFALIAVLVVVGWRALARAWPRGARGGLLMAAGAGLVLGAAPSLPGLRTASVWLDRVLPGGAFLRDSQKFAIPLLLAESVGFGLGVHVLLERSARRAETARTRRWVTALAVLMPLVPVALAPTLAWGAGGRLHTAEYPPSWSRVEALMATDPVRGAVLVLPWHADLPFGWNGGRTVDQPAASSFSRPVVTSSALEVGRETLPDEDPWAALARPAVLSGRPIEPALGRLGIRYVLLFHEADWRRFLPQVSGLPVALSAADLTMYRGPPPPRIPRFEVPPAPVVLAGDALAGAVILAVAAGMLRSRRRPTRGEAS